jgi:hypothetical protein
LKETGATLKKLFQTGLFFREKWVQTNMAYIEVSMITAV